MLLTNDGALAHDLLSPKKHVDKCYYAKVRGEVTAEDVQRFADGLDIGDEKRHFRRFWRFWTAAASVK